jgi:hypothetical protein
MTGESIVRSQVTDRTLQIFLFSGPAMEFQAGPPGIEEALGSGRPVLAGTVESEKDSRQVDPLSGRGVGVLAEPEQGLLRFDEGKASLRGGRRRQEED